MGLAITYYQLGTIAKKQSDVVAAEHWYKQSLAIYEKYGDNHGAAINYLGLGNLSFLNQDYQNISNWYLKALLVFFRHQDNHNLTIVAKNYVLAVQAADPTNQFILRQRWADAGLDQIITLDQLEQQLNGNA